MFKKVLMILALIAVLCFVGCKKGSDEDNSVEIKTAAEYEQEAQEQITEDNMGTELDRLEKSIDSDIELEQ